MGHDFNHRIRKQLNIKQSKIMNVLTLNYARVWSSQKDFIFYLYSVLFLVFAIFFLLIFSAYTNPMFFDVIKQYFILNTSNLNSNVFFSSYTHTNLNHLKENILSYSIVFLLIFSFVDNKVKLKSLMLMALIVFPFVNSILLTLFFDITAGGGLSGIVACLHGYLFFAGYHNLKNKLQLSVKMLSVVMLICFNLLVAQYFILKNYYILLFAIVIFLLLIYQNKGIIRFVMRFMWESINNVEINNIDENIEKLRIVTTWIFALVFSLTVFRMLSPVIPITLEINYFTHYVGWFYGLIISWFILK